MNGSVQMRMNAPIDKVWALVSDVTRVGEFSPETFEAEWVTPGGPHVGARFRGHVRRNGRGPVYWTDCRVTECQEPNVFAFGVYAGNNPVNSWRYELEAIDDTTTNVTESFALAVNPLTRAYWAVAGRARRRFNERSMRQTLDRMRAVVEG